MLPSSFEDFYCGSLSKRVNSNTFLTSGLSLLKRLQIIETSKQLGIRLSKKPLGIIPKGSNHKSIYHSSK